MARLRKAQDGRDGRDGAPGRDGERGPEGPRGPAGKDGAPGRDGKPAAENLVEINAGIAALLARECTAEHVAGGYTVGDVLRILAAVAVGKTTITSPGAGSAFVTFRSIDDALDTVAATMSGSERVSVTLDPTETS